MKHLYEFLAVTEDISYLKKFCYDNNWLIKCHIAQNSNCPIDILEKYYKFNHNNHYNIFSYIVRNPNCPVYLLEKILKKLKYYDVDVKKLIAKHPNCSIHIIKKLIKEKNLAINFSIAENNNVTENILNKLLNLNKNHYIIINIIKNKNCTLKILKKIYKETVKYNEIVKYNNDIGKMIINEIMNNDKWVLRDFI